MGLNREKQKGIFMKNHKDLEVWKESINLVKLIYEVTKKLPKDEIFGLTLQIKKSVISIPSNIAEGAARQSNKEFIQFLYIALGSLSELETQLIIANNLNFVNIDNSILELIEKIRKMIIGLIKYNKNKIQ